MVIHTIGIGRDSGPIGYLPEYYNISASFNEELLIDVAESTGGNYFLAFSDEALDEAVDYILEKAEKRKIPIDFSFGLLLVSITILFIEWGLLNTRFRKIP